MIAFAVLPARAALWLPRVLPFVCYIAFLAIGPMAANVLPDSRWVYAIQIAAVAALLAAFYRSYSELLHPPPLALAECVAALAVGIAVFIVWINLDIPLLTVGESSGFDPRAANGAISWPLALVRLFGAAAVVPVMEELFWRSFILRWLDQKSFLDKDPRSVSMKALALSSLVFGFEHTLWFAGVLAGLAYGWLYRRSGNLWIPIVAHATTNLLLGLWVLTTGKWNFW